MSRAFLSFVLIFVVGVLMMVIGHEILGGFPELGAIASIAVAGGCIVYFGDKKD